MARSVRLLLAGLSLALAVALVGAPGASTQADDTARIDAPANGESVVGTVEVRGRAVTADPSRFSFYRLYYGAGALATSLRPIGNASDRPVDGGVLGSWDTAPLVQGEYLLQLSVYDTSGATTTAHVVVNVLPAPTPTPRNQPAVLIPVPGLTPTAPEDDTGPTPTPLPEIEPLVPQIPQIDVPQQNPGPLPVQPAQPAVTDPNVQPIPINQGAPSSLPPPPLPPAPSSSGPPPFDPGSSIPPAAPPANPINPINPVGPPPPPVIAPYEPPPTVPGVSTPTPFGLPGP
jgi:hypothetical protein